MTISKPWWTLEDDAFAMRASRIVAALKKDEAQRRGRYQRNLALYENRDLGNDGDYLNGQTQRQSPSFADIEAGQILRQNLTRSAADSAHAELCGRQKPKPQFATTRGSWADTRKGKNIDRAVESIMRAQHGKYPTAWDLGEDVLLDAIVLADGVIKCVADATNGRVLYERTHPWAVSVDSGEAERGDIRTCAHTYRMDLDIAAETFSSAEQMGILEAAGSGLLSTPEADTANETVELVELWRAGTTESPGVHAFLCGGRLLHREEWVYELPFAFIHWAPPRLGFWGTSLVEEGERMQMAFDEDLQKLDERVRKCSGMRTWVPRQSGVSATDLEGNESGTIIQYDGAQPPITEVPNPIAPSELQFHAELKTTFFEVLGISQMRAASKREPGVTSGIAIRSMNDIQTLRFALKAKAYEGLYVQLGRITVCALHQLYSGEGEAKPLEWRAGNRLVKFAWEDIDITPSQIVCTVAPASALGNDQAGKLQTMQELPAMGISLPQDTVLRLLGWPDLARELGLSEAESDHNGQTVEGILAADEDDDEALYPDPDPLVSDKAGFMRLVSQEYHQAVTMDAPEYVLDALREFIRKIDALMAPPPAPPAPPAGPPGAAAGPPMGMPPGAPEGMPMQAPGMA